MEHMPQSIEGFTHIEYLIVFNAIIFGYVGAEYFIGWGAILRNREKVVFYWQHLLWTIFAFLLFMQNWWGIWPRTQMINKGLIYFIYSLVPILLFHLISVLLFPNFSQKGIVDLKQHFYKNTKWLFSLFSIYFLLTIISSFVYPDVGNVLVQNIIRLVGVLLSLGAAYFHQNKTIHIIFLAVGFCALLNFLAVLPTE